MRFIPKEEQEEAAKYLNTLNENNIGYVIDPADGTIYFNSEEDKRKAKDLEKKLEL